MTAELRPDPSGQPPKRKARGLSIGHRRRLGYIGLAAGVLIGFLAWWMGARPYDSGLGPRGLKTYPTAEAYSAWLSTFKNTQLHGFYVQGTRRLAERRRRQAFLWGGALVTIAAGVLLWRGGIGIGKSGSDG
jgi:hypothetical protein